MSLSQRTRHLLMIRENVIDLVMGHMGWGRAKANVWYHSDNPLLGNVSPYYMVKHGREDKLMTWIKSQIAGEKP